ncbi:hypothetical protein B296_00012058 [Ensete ventricosum]|uniref:Glutamyl/glutaminyl-tRNA synthetase class Ib anti-codon binding domain-containing protein n=1 Tax=Ensete ventricosum TaxID=4639 RepID=A0A427AW57_ENSVE|nr:hypothetical protein B296_00012058 [Ensete ventricosum]
MIRADRLEYHIREELNKTAPRTMVVLDPLKVVITNLDSGSVIDLDAKMWPDAPSDDSSSYYKVLISLNFSTFANGVLHWVGQPSPGVDPVKVEVRLFEKLFLSEVGYFAVDTDSTPGKLVFNRTITLRDSYSKGGNK